jgi:hypothetical protein
VSIFKVVVYGITIAAVMFYGWRETKLREQLTEAGLRSRNASDMGAMFEQR